MEPEEESRLIEEARSDPEAFARLYDHYLPIVYGYVIRRVKSKEAAEDITSQTFEKALRSIKRLREGTSFKVWIYRIAGNNIIDYYRTRGRQQEYDLGEAQEVVNGKSGRAAEAVENRLVVMELLEKLPEGHRNALVLHYLEGLTVEEMAEVLGSSPSACYMKVYRATRALADLLKKQGIRRLDNHVAG